MTRRREHFNCSFPECPKAHKAHGYCASHYQQFQRGESLRPLQLREYDRPEICVEPGCEKAAHTKGLCKAHYLKLWKATKKIGP